MSTVNCSVSQGYTWTEDAAGEIQITKTRLNLAAKPTVTVDMAGAIATADLASGAVSAAKLADAVADEILTGAVTVGDNVAAGSPISVSVQAKDAQGNAVAKRVLVELWLSNAAAGGPNVSTFPSTYTSPTAGVELVANADNVIGRYLTDATGLLTLSYTNSGALSGLYAVAVVGGKYYAGSQALAWTA